MNTQINIEKLDNNDGYKVNNSVTRLFNIRLQS